MAGAGKTPQGTTSGAYAYVILGVLAVAFCVVTFGSGGMKGGLFGDSLRGAGSADKKEPTQAVAELEDKARADNMFDIDFANGGNTIYYDFARQDFPLDKYVAACDYVTQDLAQNYAGYALVGRTVQTKYQGVPIYGCPAKNTVRLEHLKEVRPYVLSFIEGINFRHHVQVVTRSCPPQDQECAQEAGSDAARLLSAWIFSNPMGDSRDEQWRRDTTKRTINVAMKVSKEPPAEPERAGRNQDSGNFATFTVQGANVDFADVGLTEPLFGDVLANSHKKVIERLGGNTDYDPFLYLAVDLVYDELTTLGLLNEAVMEDDAKCQRLEGDPSTLNALAEKHNLANRVAKIEAQCRLTNKNRQ